MHANGGRTAAPWHLIPHCGEIAQHFCDGGPVRQQFHFLGGQALDTTSSWPASLDALAACALVLVIGAFAHRPLSQVPENALKFGVGLMLSALGVFWTGEGLGVEWPEHDLALLVLVAIFLIVRLMSARMARRLTMEAAQ